MDTTKKESQKMSAKKAAPCAHSATEDSSSWNKKVDLALAPAFESDTSDGEQQRQNSGSSRHNKEVSKDRNEKRSHRRAERVAAGLSRETSAGGEGHEGESKPGGEDSAPGALAVPGSEDDKGEEESTTGSTPFNIVDATLVDEKDELERLRHEVMEQAQARQELLKNVVTAEGVVVVDADTEIQKAEGAAASPSFCQTYWWLLWIGVILGVGGIIGGVVAALKNGGGSSTPTRSPTIITPPTDGSPARTASASPSMNPTTSAPSLAPTMLPTLTNEACAVDVEISCDADVLTPEVEPCELITVPSIAQCEHDPYQMTLRFNGGSCDQSANLLDRRLSDFCQDFGDIPLLNSSGVEHQYYVVVVDMSSSQVVGEHFVAVEDTFTIGGSATNAGELSFTVLPPQLEISVYDNSQQENVLQIVSFSTSCTDPPLFLFDRFGSFQYVALKNEIQGEIPAPIPDDFFLIDISLLLTIKGRGTNRLRIDEVNLIVNFDEEPQRFESRISGEGPLVDRQISFLLDAPYTWDLEYLTRYTAFVTVIGNTTVFNSDLGEEEVIQCNGFDFYETTTGLYAASFDEATLPPT